MSAADPIAILPGPTRQTWRRIVPILPSAAYLMGGTALAVRLGHRQSLDLDFFLEAAVDLAALAEQLGLLAPTVVQMLSDDTLNCLFAETRLQFLAATTQRMIAPPEVIADVRVGALPDLMATKLVAILGRPAIRDYVDLWALETIGGVPVDRGLAFVEERYPRAADERTWRLILLALGSFADVRGDPMPRIRGQRLTARQLERYWRLRVPQIAAALDEPDDGRMP